MRKTFYFELSSAKRYIIFCMLLVVGMLSLLSFLKVIPLQGTVSLTLGGFNMHWMLCCYGTCSMRDLSNLFLVLWTCSRRAVVNTFRRMKLGGTCLLARSRL